MNQSTIHQLRRCAWISLFAFASASLLPTNLAAAEEEELTEVPALVATEEASVAPAAATPTDAEPAPDDADSSSTVLPEMNMFHGEQVVGVFQSAHLRSHESADQVVAVFGDVIAEGEVDEQVVAVFGNATVMQDVGEMVVCVFGDVTIGPGVHIGEMLVVIGGTINIDPTATVGEQIVNIPLPGFSAFNLWLRDSLLQGRLYHYDRRSTWTFVGVLLLLNLALGALFRRPVENGARALDRKPAMTLINGLLTAVIVPPLVFLLLITGVGVLVLPFLFAAILITAWIGVLGLFSYCGAQFGFHRQPLLALAAGHLLFAAIFSVPYLGLVVWSLTILLGLGTALTALSEARRREAHANGAPPKPPAPPTPPPVRPAPPTVAAAVTSPPAASAFAASTESRAAEVDTPEDAEPVSPLPPTSEPPPPSRAAAPPPLLAGTLPRAGLGPRLAATLLDLLVVFVAARFLNSDDLFPYLWLGYHVAFWTWRATTLGGAILNIRIERLDGRPVDFGISLVRALSSILSLLAVGLGFLWVIWDPERQSWHDKIAGTTIVRAPRGHSLI